MKKSQFQVLSMLGLSALASYRSIACLIVLIIIYLIVYVFKYLIEKEKTKQIHDDNERIIKTTQIISDSISKEPEYKTIQHNYRSTHSTESTNMHSESKKILIKQLNQNMHYRHNHANAYTSESKDKAEDVVTSASKISQILTKRV